MLLSNIDTEYFSVYWCGGGYKAGVKIFRGDAYTDCCKKVWEWPPWFMTGLEQVGLKAGVHCSPVGAGGI